MEQQHLVREGEREYISSVEGAVGFPSTEERDTVLHVVLEGARG